MDIPNNFMQNPHSFFPMNIQNNFQPNPAQNNNFTNQINSNHNLNLNAKAFISPKLYKNLKSPTKSNFQSNNNNLNSNGNTRIIEVYEENFIKEIKRIGKYLQTFPYIGMDTEFPGIVYPCPEFTPDFYYKFNRENVNNLKLIQLGITLTNDKGETPQNISTWQFNLKFNIDQDDHSLESITMLMNCGIDFEVIKKQGIPYDLFAEYFSISGLVLNENVTWISFNGLSDFCYLLKIVLNENLPESEDKFLEKLKIYFPNIYDIKYLINDNEQYKGGLNKLAKELNVERTGEIHQAGSDSIVTSDVFFRLIKNNTITQSDLFGKKDIIYGIGKGTDINETLSYTQFAKDVDIGSYLNNMGMRNNNMNNYFNGQYYSNFQ